jgi:hypothetical protein
VGDLKVRHFLLQTKAVADLQRRPGTTSAITDAEIRELLESIWIAERADEQSGLDLAELARRYSVSDWAVRDNTPGAMERALSRATLFYDALEVCREPLLI